VGGLEPIATAPGTREAVVPEAVVVSVEEESSFPWLSWFIVILLSFPFGMLIGYILDMYGFGNEVMNFFELTILRKKCIDIEKIKL